MYPFLSDFLKPHHFSHVHDLHHYIEVVDASTSTSTAAKIECKQGTLTEAQLAGWLSQDDHWNQPEHDHINTEVNVTATYATDLRTNFATNARIPTTWRLRVLFSPARRDPGLSKEPYYFSRETYNRIVQAFRLPPDYLTLVSSSTPIRTNFELGDGSTGILANLSTHGLALLHNPQQRLTVCYVVGLCEHQIRRCQAELQSVVEHAHDPILFPTIWLEVFIETRVRRAAARTDVICDIQKGTGLHWSVTNMEEIARKINFKEVTFVLNVLGSELAWDACAIKELTGIQERLLKMHKQLSLSNRISQPSGSPGTSHVRLEYVDVVATRLVHSKDILFGLRAKTRYNADQVAMQGRSIYNLISHRGNRLANETADDLRSIARATQADNAALRSIAEDSRYVAYSTRRDGSDMRVIAVVTLLFLPGTFVATIFSTSFFDFSPRTSHAKHVVVSKMLWIYIAITISLTVTVVSAWYLITQKKHATFKCAESGCSLPSVLSRQDEEAISEPIPAVVPLSHEGNYPSSFHTDNVDERKATEVISRSRQQDGLPASKVVMNGVNQGDRTCACCARFV